MKIAFYDTKPYDKIWFEPMAKEKNIEILFLEEKLNKHTAAFAKDTKAKKLLFPAFLYSRTVNIAVRPNENTRTCS